MECLSLKKDCVGFRNDSESMIKEIRAKLEKKLVVLNRIGLSFDELDEEEQSRQLLEMTDDRPFTYTSSLLPFRGENLEPYSESSHTISLGPTFRRWCDESHNSKSWIQGLNLPLMFKFALQRPLMPESKLWFILRDLNIDPTLRSVGNFMTGTFQSRERYRKILSGGVMNRPPHVSYLRHQFPTGLSLLYQKPENLNHPNEPEILDGKKRVRKCIRKGADPFSKKIWLEQTPIYEKLKHLYKSIQDDGINPNEALLKYRELLEFPESSDFVLTLILNQFGIPIHHIPRDKVSPLDHEAKDFRHGSKRHIIGLPNDESATDNIAVLAGYINLYRFGKFSLDDAMLMIQEILEGLVVNKTTTVEILCDHSMSALLAARMLWDDACENAHFPADGQKVDIELPVNDDFIEICNNLFNSNQNSEVAVTRFKDIFEGINLSNAQQSFVLNNFNVPPSTFMYSDNLPEPEHSQLVTKKVSCGLEFSSTPRNSLPNTHLQPNVSLDMSCSNKSLPGALCKKTDMSLSPENNSLLTSYMSDDVEHHSLRSQHGEELEIDVKSLKHRDLRAHVGKVKPEISLSLLSADLRQYSGASPMGLNNDIREELDDESISNPSPLSTYSVVPELASELKEGNSDSKVPFDILSDDNSVASSPEKGTSDDLFGLPLSTEDARVIGAKLRLPPDYINKCIRSTTPRRANDRKFQKASTIVTFPIPAPDSLIPSYAEQRTSVKKSDTFPDLFAQNGQDSLTFVKAHFTKEILESIKRRCIECLRLLCACETGNLRQLPLPNLSRNPMLLKATIGSSEMENVKNQVDYSQEDMRKSPDTLNKFEHRGESQILQAFNPTQLEPDKINQASIAPFQSSIKQLIMSCLSLGSHDNVLAYLQRSEAIQHSDCELMDEVAYEFCYEILRSVGNFAEPFIHENPDNSDSNEDNTVSQEQINFDAQQNNSTPQQHQLIHLMPLPSATCGQDETPAWEVCASIRNFSMSEDEQPFKLSTPSFLERSDCPSKINEEADHMLTPSVEADKHHPEPTLTKQFTSTGCVPQTPRLTTRQLSLPPTPRPAALKPPPTPRLKSLEYSPVPIQPSRHKYSSESESLSTPGGNFHKRYSRNNHRHSKSLRERICTIEGAEDEALRQRKSLYLFLLERRALRAKADKKMSESRHFQSSSGASGASNLTSTLNKLFDRYRGLYPSS